MTHCLTPFVASAALSWAVAATSQAADLPGLGSGAVHEVSADLAMHRMPDDALPVALLRRSEGVGASRVPVALGCPDAVLYPRYASRPPELHELPVVRRLEPVGPGYERAFLRHLDRHINGRIASTVLRDSVSFSRAYWTIAAWGADPGPYPIDEEYRVTRHLALALVLAAEDMGHEVLDRSPVMGPLGELAHSLYAPTVSLFRRNDGRMSLSASPSRDPRQRTATTAVAALEDVDDAPVPVAQRPPSGITAGASLRVRDLDEDADMPLVDASVYLSGTRVGVQAWRVSGLLSSRQWVANASQRVSRWLTLTATVRSTTDNPLPGVATVGTLSPLYPILPRRWQLRTYYTFAEGHRDRIRGDRDDHRVGVVLRANWRWRAPWSPYRWGTGNRWDRPGTPVPGANPGRSSAPEWVVPPDAVALLVEQTTCR